MGLHTRVRFLVPRCVSLRLCSQSWRCSSPCRRLRTPLRLPAQLPTGLPPLQSAASPTVMAGVTLMPMGACDPDGCPPPTMDNMYCCCEETGTNEFSKINVGEGETITFGG